MTTSELAEGETTEDVETPEHADAEAGVDEPGAGDPTDSSGPTMRASARRWRRMLTYGLLPALAMVLALGAGYLKWMDSSIHGQDAARTESVNAATEGAIAMLSYRPDAVEMDLTGASDRLTGPLKDSYGTLTRDVVIPGAQQKQISAVATVPAAATVSATQKHAVVLVFVNQEITIGAEPPTNTASRVRVTLDEVGGRWLIAGFDPI
ncbi:hypothetical protein [Mycolicibacterium setense]|uniref:hypothetical protein n=1 Tax=Mycolicibacterium setense TaxID=431269 RepID=UPI0005747E61|nr:hypothetical protein [Mycolicibacterium setense]KHO21670.1 membrane protein [Mycolicibacterium setense]MCV7114207.1 hypothetical protein [Mycolicibacterium setense]